MIELNLREEGEVSINFFRGLLAQIVNDICEIEYSTCDIGEIGMYAKLYASFSGEIANAEYRPPSQNDKNLDPRIFAVCRWNSALFGIEVRGDWSLMKNEILLDSQEYLKDPSFPDAIEIGNALEELANHL